MSVEIFQVNQKLNVTISNSAKESMSYSPIINLLINEETRKSFNIKVSPSELSKIKDFKLSYIAKKINLHGFRPGKAPLSVVWTQYKDSITSEIVNDGINDIIEEINKILSANLITSPKVDLKHFSFEEGLEFEATLEMLPKIILPDIGSISLTKPIYEIKTEDIKNRVKELYKHRKNYVTSKDGHKAEKGDQVVIDFEGKIDGTAFPGGAAKDHAIELGSKSFIDNFEDQLIGHKKNDQVLVNVTFPSDYHEKKFAGQKAQFDVTIKELKLEKSFENDEELAKSIGFESLLELEKKISESLEKECANKSLLQMKVELFDKLDAICNFNIPQIMIDQEFNALWKQVEEKLKHDKDNKKTEEELKEEYLKIAIRRIKLGVLLTQLSGNYNIKIEQQDFINAVRAQIDSQHPSMAQSIIQYYNSNPKAIESLKGPILEEKTVTAILNDVKFIEKPITVKELLEGEE